MKRLLVLVSCLFVSQASFAADLRSQIRDLALQISGAVGSAPVSDAALADMLDQLQTIEAKLSGDGAGSGELYCEPLNSVYSYVTKTATGQHLGSFVDADLCTRAVATAKSNLLCMPLNSVYANLYNYRTETQITGLLDIGTCNQELSLPGLNLVCNQVAGSWRLDFIANNQLMWRLDTTGDCH